jgi:hyaluronoglucosaminidase
MAWFGAPVLSDTPVMDQPSTNEKTFAAIERLLWRWKTPLSREWYPFIFGLKHDLLMAKGELPPLRITKTQTPALSRFLFAGDEEEHKE